MILLTIEEKGPSREEKESIRTNLGSRRSGLTHGHGGASKVVSGEGCGMRRKREGKVRVWFGNDTKSRQRRRTRDGRRRKEVSNGSWRRRC